MLQRLLSSFMVVWLVAGCAATPSAPPAQTAAPEATVLPSPTRMPSATTQPTATELPAPTLEATATVISETIEEEITPGCTMVSLFPTPGPTQVSLFPPVSAEDWVQGPETASVTILEYSDFQ